MSSTQALHISEMKLEDVAQYIRCYHNIKFYINHYIQFDYIAGAKGLRRNHAFDRFSQSFLEALNTMDIEGI
jgi:hypothetical protein